MTHLYNRLLVAITLMVMLALGLVAAVSCASAGTGPWQWADISENLGARENRPVWASAYAHPYWYLTDGQELYTGGHVWKTDGAIMEDITVEVRNAGLNRVDDIVTDGQTVMFLKNVVTAANTFEVLTYKDGNWGYPAGTWKNNMYSNEAILSVNGKDGVWMIVSNKGNVYRWKQNTNEFTRLNLPNEVKNNLDINLNFNPPLMYNVNHGSSALHADYGSRDVAIILKMLPLTNSQWLLVARIDNNNGNYKTVYYQYNGYNFSEITDKFNTNYTPPVKVASNGSEAILIYNHQTGQHGVRLNTYPNGYIKTYDGYNVTDVSAHNEMDGLNIGESIIADNGKSWMIITNKKLFRLEDNHIDYYGETRDYFITISGNGNGTFMAGGAVSSIDNPDPNSPLTAKLVRVDESTGYNPPGTPVVNTQNNVWASMGVSHNKHKLYHGQSSNVNITGGSPNGIDRIEIWLNGDVVKTCHDNDCSYTIYGSSYNKGSALAFNGRVVDEQGHEAWTWLGEYSVPVDNYYNNNNNNNNDNYDNFVTAWFDGSVDKTVLGRNQSRTITFYGNANRGLDKLELFVNGNSVGSCNFNSNYGDKSCSKTIYGSNYNSGQNITLKVRATDRDGYQKQSGSISFNIKDYNSDNNGDQIYAWMWFDPSDTSLDHNETKTIHVGATADDGLRKIEIYTDGALKRTCNFSRAYGNQECSVDIYGNNYSANRNISIFARVTDYYGRVQQTNSQSIHINSDNNNNQNDVNGNLTITSNRDSGYNNYDQITFTANGWDDNGIDKIEILVNATVVKTCYNSNSCSYTGGPYTTETVSYGANLYDNLGKRTWTGYKTIYKN